MWMRYLDAYLRLEERAAGFRAEEKTVRIGSSVSAGAGDDSTDAESSLGRPFRSSSTIGMTAGDRRRASGRQL